MGSGEVPDEGGINDKNFAITSCLEYKIFVKRFIQVKTVSSGQYGERYYIATCGK
jgi:hypothetical protein